MQLQQNDVDALRNQLEHLQIKKDIENRRLEEVITLLEDKVIIFYILLGIAMWCY